MRRTPRDWSVDVGLFLFAAVFSVIAAGEVVGEEEIAPGWLLVDQATGAAACTALFWRRRWPVPVTLGLLVLSHVSHFVTGPLLVALFTVAVRCPTRTTGWVAGLSLAPLPVFLLTGPELGQPRADAALTFFALVAGAIGWGRYVRSRRQLIASLRERAERAAREGRRQAREDIAREMHDVLAHRLSLLSVHAGALEYNPRASGEEVRRAAGVIRDSAHQALQELREIIDVLRAPGDETAPRAGLADVAELVAEARAAGARVEVHRDLPDDAWVPPAVSRTAFRVVQEGLTNARKHAPGAPVTVLLGGGPGEGLTVEVRNPTAGGGAAAERHAIPGAGRGLAGLAERARLADGRLEHGGDGGDFRLRAWLPWTPAVASGRAAAPNPEVAPSGSAPATGAPRGTDGPDAEVAGAEVPTGRAR